MVGMLGLIMILQRTPYVTGTGLVIQQPVPFSHEHHVSGLGLDCRYCHGTVETGAFAGMPSTSTCMKCHGQIWTEADILEPVRQSFQTGRPIRWTRVHDLADYVYFDHSIHVNKGVACATCHGPVDQMPLVRKAQPLTMQWCLDCHRNPEPFVGPRARVFDMPSSHDPASTPEPAPHPEVDAGGLTNCSTCHR